MAANVPNEAAEAGVPWEALLDHQSSSAQADSCRHFPERRIQGKFVNDSPRAVLRIGREYAVG